MSVCFIGHREIDKTENLIKKLRETIINLIKTGESIFYFGSKSAFDDLALKIITEIKEECPHIKRVYVRSAFQYIDKFYEDYLSNFYEETYFPLKLENAGKCSYVERNYEMIDKSTYCVFYYNVNFVPINRVSGTKIAYDYAKKKCKKIINLYK